jgi:expansin (peptidoglycan-binding protein)
VKRGRAASRGKGRGTFFTPSDDACTGRTSSKKDFIVAMNEADFGQPKGKDTEDAKNCNKCLEVRYKKKKIIVKVTDLCPKRFCSKGALDFAPGAFKALEPNLKLGVIKVSWKVLKNCNKWKKRG